MRKALLAAVAGAAVTAAVVGGFAWATIPAANGVIKACYQKNNGQLRVVDDAAACNPSELAISWNQNGPQGARGATGAQGPQGSRGPTGADGSPGAQGQQGPQGSQGPQGISGQDGRNGSNGAKGDRGATGATGAQGQMGLAGPTGPSGSAPVVPPSPWSTRSGSDTTFNFSLELESGDAVRVTSFAGCLPSTVTGRPSNCYFTIRGLPDSLAAWLNDSLAGNPDAVQDLTVRDISFTGTPTVQFRLHNAFITKSSIALDGNSGIGSFGEVDLVVATNSFDQQTPTPAPTLDNTNAFFKGDFSLAIEGSAKAAVIKIDDLGFSVPRLGTTTYVPGAPSIDDLHVSVSSATSPTATTNRAFFTSWANNVAQGNTDRRDGTVDLDNSSFTPLAHVQLLNLEPLTLFDPMIVDGAQSITFSAEHLQYQP